MIVLYVMSVDIYNTQTRSGEAEEEAAEVENPPNIPHAVLIPAGQLIGDVVMSELLVGAVEPVVKQIGHPKRSWA
jgi:Ca2+/H+ antiporter